MNANELIEFQEDNASEARANGFSDDRYIQTATMLRQQQAEIETLKKIIASFEYFKKSTREMNTVELASRILTQLGFYQEPSKEIGIDDRRDNIVYLIEEYTHPAKTLTDEEIINIIERLIATWTDEFKNYEYDSDESEENKLRDDVFAILRKAQEK